MKPSPNGEMVGLGGSGCFQKLQHLRLVFCVEVIGGPMPAAWAMYATVQFMLCVFCLGSGRVTLGSRVGLHP